MSDAPDPLGKLRAEIEAYEVKYGMTTEQMFQGFRDGTVDDTADTSRWMVLAKALGIIETRRAAKGSSV